MSELSRPEFPSAKTRYNFSFVAWLLRPIFYL